LTDVYGDVILREAFNTSQLVFNYQEQAEVYDSVRAIAFRALEYLALTGDNVNAENLRKGDQYFYGGDVNKWKKFAYSVIARSYNHLSNKTDYKPDSVIKYANLGINTNADNATAKFANTGIAGTANAYGPLRGATTAIPVGPLRQTAFIAALVSGTNPTFEGAPDPRAAYLIRENTNGTFKGVLPGQGTSSLAVNDQPRNFYGGAFGITSATSDTGARYIFKNASQFPVLTNAETKFVLAEAYYRKGSKALARQAYIDGINASFDLLISNYETSIPPQYKITADKRAAYLSNPKVVPPDNLLSLSHIMLQKYIALYGYGIIETWVDMRRYHYNADTDAGNPVYADFTPPSGSNLFVNNNNKLVYRARPRYNSEYLYNVKELERIGAIALDYHTKEMWFSQK
jgi:hypothetical protein